MRTFNGVEPTVLYPPLGDEESYYSADPERSVFFPSRVAPIKRQDLAVEAMRYVSSDVRLVIAGPGDMERVSRLAAAHDVGGRVELLGGWMPEARKLDLLARCLGVLFPPYDEDYGYVTLEGFLLQAGDYLYRLRRSGRTGRGRRLRVRHRARPASHRRGDRPACGDRQGAARMGAAGRERVRALEINWDHVVEELTA